MSAVPRDDEQTGLIHEIDELYPDRWALLLIPVCHCDGRHEHGGAPCAHAGKVPIEAAWNARAVERWRAGEGREQRIAEMAAHRSRGANIGLAIPVGVAVLDADTLDAVRALDELLGDAPMQTTSKGAHFVVAVPENIEINATVKLMLAGGIRVDVRSAGRSQIVVAPSVHASGTAYQWVRELPADLAELPPCPPEILARLVATTKIDTATSGGSARRIGEGSRNAYLHRIGCGMRARGLVEREIRDELHRENARMCTPPLDGAEVDGIAESVMRYAAGEPTPDRVAVDADGSASDTEDLANAHRIASHHGHELRWCAELGWLAWTGTVWRASETRALAIAARLGRHVHGEASELAAQAAAAESEGARERLSSRAQTLIRWARQSESARRIRAALDLARPSLEVVVDDLDADPWLLATASGTVELRTGTLRAHRAMDYLTRCTPVAYDPDARSDLWERVLGQALPDPDVRDYLARCAGYTAAGVTGEDVVVVVHGPTRSAKGTVQGAIAAALGDYAQTAGLEAFAARDRADGSRARPELARLRGARMVSIYETGRALRLDAALLKTLAGSDRIVARPLYGAEIEYTPTCTLWIASNHRPRLDADDDAVWARVREIPYGVQIPEAQRDPTVRARLADPADGGPAVLAWIVAGCRAWQTRGLAMPDRVRAASDEYRAAMDPVADWLADCCTRAPGAWAPSAALRESYESWCRSRGERAVSGRVWADALRRHGCEPDRTYAAGRGWRGIGLATGEAMTP